MSSSAEGLTLVSPSVCSVSLLDPFTETSGWRPRATATTALHALEAPATFATPCIEVRASTSISTYKHTLQQLSHVYTQPNHTPLSLDYEHRVHVQAPGTDLDAMMAGVITSVGKGPSITVGSAGAVLRVLVDSSFINWPSALCKSP